MRAAIDAVVDRFGQLDRMVHNAGIAGPTAPIEEVTQDQWEKTLGDNVTGKFLMIKHATDHLRERDRECIVNFSSISGNRPLENRVPYTTSKMGVIGLTRTVAMELGADGITVNALCPGPASGDRIERVIAA